MFLTWKHFVIFPGNEAVLFLRLHLLQGVVAFHQGKSLEATRIFIMAEEELKRLTINDEDLSHLLDLGTA